jgi:S1-C subfamily serine protease
MRTLFRSHFVSALLGGLVVGGSLIVLGVAGHQRTETIVEESPVAAQTAANSTSGLTAHDIYQRDGPGVVFVRATLIDQVQSPFNLLPADESDTSTGSGFLVDRRGDILTSYHVIDGAARAGGVTVKFEDDFVRAASVVAVNQNDDLAVLHVDMRGVPPVVPLQLGDSTSVRVGDPTLTIGDPYGVDRTLTSGIVSALQHQIRASDGVNIDNVIQTDQRIDVANSGGPLLDAEGRVIGINSQLATAGTGSASGQPVSIAVPIDTVDAILARVDAGGPVRLAYIGLGGQAARALHPGATVASIAKGGPAAVAGLRVGDTIERIEGVPVHSVSQVLRLVSTRSPGQTLSLEVRRGRRIRALTVVLGSRTAPQPGQ